MQVSGSIVRRAAPAAVASLLLVTVALAGPSGALGLTMERHEYDLEFEGSVDCGDFIDLFVDRYHVREVDVFDDAGALLRIVFYATHTSDDVNSVSGFTLHEHGQFREVDDFVSGTYTITGNQEIANRRGAGIVIQDTGRVVYNADFEPIFFAGGRKHSQLLLGEEIWCDALR